jgi:hypothetical protein
MSEWSVNVQKELNKWFCARAEELRFESMDGTFFKGEHMKADDVDPSKTGVLRSIKSVGGNYYVFVLDIDSDGPPDDNIMQGAHLLRMGMKNYFNVDCFIKETGNKGMHVVGFVHLHIYWGEKHCLEHMRDMAHTVWSLMGLSRLGIDIGRNCRPPYVDMHMFERGRMVRAFSRHPKSGKYPTVITEWPNETHLLCLWPPEPVYQRPARMPMIRYVPRTATIIADTQVSTAQLAAVARANVAQPTEEFFSHMPENLQKLVSFDGDPPHENKVALILWLRANTDLTADQMAAWIWHQCRWEDLTDFKTTLYQVRYTCQWSDRIMETEGARPYYRWVYG